MVSEATRDTNPQDRSAHGQSPLRTTQAQTQVIRDRDGRLLYTDDQGRVLRPVTSRHDDRHRSLIDPAQTTPQRHRGATSESYGRNQPTISQASERTPYIGSTAIREVPDFQRESRYPGEDVSGGMARLQTNTDARSDDQISRAEATKEVIDRLRRAGRTAISKQELERLIDEQLERHFGQK